jgi:ParB/RepB/Spo0J family partition protein
MAGLPPKKTKGKIVKKSKSVKNEVPQFRFEEIPVGQIVVDDGWNSRKRFDEEQLFALGESLREAGQAQTIVVNCTDDGVYHLVSGERRLRAAREAGVERLAAKVYDDAPTRLLTELRFAENFHRANLTHIEQALDMERMEEAGFSIAEIAERAGMSEDTVRRKISLLELPEDVQQMIDREQNPLPVHQAQLLVGLSTSDAIRIARDAAPIVGAVAGEQQVRRWVEQITKGPELPMEEDEERPQKQSSAKSGGKVLSNVRYDPDEDADAGIETDGELLKTDASMPHKTNRHKVFINPNHYCLPLPVKLKAKAEVYYATDGRRWYYNWDLSTKMGGKGGFPSADDRTNSKDTAPEAVTAALQEMQDYADGMAEQATAKTQLEVMREIIETIGRHLQIIAKAYKPAAPTLDLIPLLSREDEQHVAASVLSPTARFFSRIHQQRLILRVDEPIDCCFRIVGKKAKKFVCRLSSAVCDDGMEITCADPVEFPESCPLARTIIMHNLNGAE